MTSETINSSTLSKHYVSVPRYYLTALAELGVHEVPGAQSNPRIVDYHQATSLRATNDEVPWCSAFCCWVMAQAGVDSTHSAAAKSWLNWGVNVGLDSKKWCVGDVMVFVREGGHHVGFFEGRVQPITPVNPMVLGGNQGNSVSFAYKHGVDLLAVRRIG